VIRTGSGRTGQVRFRDCNGFLSAAIIQNTVEPQLLCATEIYSTSAGITLSGGTDIATNCCFRFTNTGPFSLGSVTYRDCNGDIVTSVIPLGGTFCGQYITQINGNGDYIQEPLCIAVTPTATASNTPTPTRTPTVTPTNTQTGTPNSTPTSTPSPTPCYEPKAYVLFDSQTGATALNTWMASQGSSFRGMFISAPSLVPATFEAQMNAYINYSGFGPSQYYALLPQTITPNQDPILWPAGGGPSWTGTFVWTNMFVPTCPICPEGEYGLMGANEFPIHTTNDARRSIPFYYSGTAIPQGFYRLYTTYGGTDMRLSNSGTQYVLGGLDCGITPTPSPTRTSTATPTNTQTSTPTGTLNATPTQTQTQTSTPPLDDCICYQYTNDGDPEGVNAISYLDCSSEFQQIDNIPFGTSGYFCAIFGSVQETEGLTYIEVDPSFCGGCGEPPVTPTQTQTQTGTPPETPTPTQTQTASGTVELCISVYNNSLDITVTDVYVNGIQATPIGVWPNTTGNGGSLTIALPSGTYTVEVFHSCSVSGQKVSVLDSSSFNQCSPITTGGSSTTFSGVAMDNIQCLLISAEDGAC
jgi:hypothetical protein